MSESRLFEIPSHWSWVPLGEIAEVELGKMLSAKAFEPDLIQLPYLRNQNVRWGTIDYSDIKLMGFKPSELERYGLKPGDLLVCEGGEPGRCAVYTRGEGELMYQKALHRIRPYGGQVLPKYLQFCLQNYVVNGFIIPRPSQTTIQHLPRERMLDLPIPVAPLPEQERIVEETEKQFTRLDAAIEILRHSQAALRKYRASILKAACVPTKNLEQNTEHLPNLPEGWCWTSLGDLLLGIEAGKNFKCEERPPQESEVGVVKVSAVTWGTFDERESKTCKAAKLINPRYFINEGDFLFSRANTIELVGACVIAGGVQRKLMLSDKILRFFFRDFPAKWILYVLRSPHGRREIEGLATGNQESMRNISRDRIRRIKIPVPPIDQIETIISGLERRLTVLEVLEKSVFMSLLKAESLRNAILKEAFRGRLVPQLSDKEAVSTLLKGIHEQRGATQSTPPPPTAMEPNSGKPPFAEQDPSEQLELAWRILFGRGLFEKEDAVRAVAEGLKNQGLAHFQRLRKDSPLFNDIASAIDRGVRQGFFDRPKRGHVRAILADPKAYSPEDWRLCLLGALDGEPVEEEDALRAAAEWARETMRLEFARLREDGLILKGLRAALKEAVGRGEVERVGRRQVRRASPGKMVVDLPQE